MAWKQTPGGVYLGSNVYGFPTRHSVSSQIIDAVGESVCQIGPIYLSTGPGTSATLNSSGKIVSCCPGSSVTYADAGTTIRAGLQAVSSGIESGTYLVYGEDTGGSGLYAQNKMSPMPMTTGSQVINHGDVFAVIVEVMAKGGTDSIRIQHSASIPHTVPYMTIDTGSGPAKQSQTANFTIDFGNGVFGFFAEAHVAAIWPTATAFTSSSTPNEYGLAFTVPFRCTLDRLVQYIGDIDSGDTGDVCLYRDAYSSSPSLMETIAVDPTNTGNVGSQAGHIELPLATKHIIDAGEDLAVTYVATSTQNRDINWREVQPGLATAIGWCSPRGVYRNNGSGGAFSTDTTKIYFAGAAASAIDIPRILPRTRAVKGL